VSNPFLGEIRLFGFNYAPVGWASCNGQVLPISQNTALFSLLGTYYGGDGVSNFALPNFQSRVPVHMGQGSGLSPYVIGEQTGVEQVTLTPAQIPAHPHSVAAFGGAAGDDRPGNNFLALTQNPTYNNTSDGTTMAATAIGSPSAPPSAFGTLPPSLTVNFCIALQGIYPARS
jgi:microcystin-dependent protein